MIVPLLEKFNAMFPELVKYNLTQSDLDGVQGRVIGFISNVEGEINLPLRCRRRAFIWRRHTSFS